jgi:uncharacterized membrane protein YfcA
MRQGLIIAPRTTYAFSPTAGFGSPLGSIVDTVAEFSPLQLALGAVALFALYRVGTGKKLIPAFASGRKTRRNGRKSRRFAKARFAVRKNGRKSRKGGKRRFGKRRSR